MVERLGNYAVTGKLADGGMGAVYRGRAPDGRDVVLKVPHAQDRESALALADEARAGMRLKHPAIVETLDCFVDRGVSVLVVAFIDGVTLFEMRKRVAQLSAAAVAEAGTQIAGALDAIHTAVDERGRPLAMLHRDVSPNNVLVDATGQVRLIDLGIVRSAERQSKATMQGMVKGTLRYLAPEILAGADHSAASDLWALGVTLYEAAVGHYAIAGDEMNTVRAVMDGTLFRQVREAPIDGALVEALQVLVCPVEQRMRNARAAAAVLGRLAAKLKDGREELAYAMRMPAARGPGTQPRQSAPLEVTEVTSKNVMGPEAMAATLLSSRGDVESVFTSSVGRASLPTLQLPAAPPPERGGTAAPSSTERAIPAAQKAPPSSTELAIPAAQKAPPSSTELAMPAARSAAATEFLPAARSVPSDAAPTIQMPAVASTFETAPTIQMTAWSPPMATASPPEVRPTSSAPVASGPVPKPPPPSALADKTAPVAPPPQKTQGPAPSLFLPIVVIDEDGSEIE